MTKFIITRMAYNSSIDSAEKFDIEVTAIPDGRHSCNYDAAELKDRIECNIQSDWCRVGTSFTDYTVFSGRGNGKTKYFSDWLRYAMTSDARFAIKQVIFNPPATIIFWADGSKTVVKCQDGDQFVPETGIAMCFMKKAMDNKANFNNIFKKHIKNEEIAKDFHMEDSPVRVLQQPPMAKKNYKHIDKEAIYRLLREKKWTVPEFAEYVGVHVTTVYAWLKGRGINGKTLSKLKKVLHVSEEDIIND